jgi:serine/threonine protein kinase
MYILITGKPPFDGDTDKKICKKVREGKYNMSGEDWEHISEEGKDLVQKFLTYNPKKRIS